jgi:hypothetical protein
MKLSTCITLFLVIAPSVNATQPEAPVDWAELHRAFTVYCHYPSDKNAIEVMRSVPNGSVEYSGAEQEHDTIDFIYDNLGMLKRQVLSRDPNAVRLAFRLKTIADGAFAEDLDILLGRLIRIDPTLFVRQLKEYGKVNRLDGLVGNLGDAYVDRFDAQRLEIKKRIRALESVSDPALKELADQCIKELKHQQTLMVH